MSSLKILITGGAGLLGEYLNVMLSQQHTIHTLYHSVAGNTAQYPSCQIDLTNPVQLHSIFQSFRPDVVVHTAAVSTPVKASALGTVTVRKINIDATELLARLSTEFGSKLIFTSTDLVYAGYRGSYLKETDKLIPISLYAESKVMAEEKVKKYAEDYFILRTALLYGKPYSQQINHFDQMIHSFIKGERVKLFTDQWRSPLSLNQAAQAILHLCSMPKTKETVNFGGTARVSRAELGELSCEILGFTKTLIEYCSAESLPDYPNVADVSMDISLLQSLGIQLSDIRSAVIEQVEKYTSAK